ncbi:MAG: putative toxin-antitoxin system toxin component, PIN family [Microcoleus sp. PH2017_39_LGB_O_B]|uniref:putative toxin-antitoxin system toxin component, PIN family n=1 Tax=unclassified Microcoleus TaxID=2642155 RepID=UPI001DEDD61D|nr:MULTISPECIES: putative toxin-antitoxin system toxin component, PIN family [unclassified Microcoleus]TAF91014.1 MAG: putative toxin-antitoxin system toxin component, PIN family [Oscillatoriales cyanobacterium]MCC3448241.1 putative toxin-antitoxin system toxin component, PIN family [Microcoleus sp. PH2017_09_SFU_O_A]MCC3588112.1 putative toxin-antitoxin system toxin component, PIN family [Microcoleus sp. PH2017_30_WIL_O_A]MCC3629212.1 putative toxin-antitoxin system toxin component, PIN family
MPEKPTIKVIIDTNLWISFLIGKELANLKQLIVDRAIQVVLCEQIIEEINLVTQRPKLQKYFPATKVQELLELLRIIGLWIEVTSEVSICRGAKDNYLLALAKDSQANFLLTGDGDLLTLVNFEGTEILTYKDFLGKINFI